jgi:hypothetical protein
LREGVRTRDLGGKESTESFTEAVAAEVSRRHGAQPQSQKTNSTKENEPSVADPILRASRPGSILLTLVVQPRVIVPVDHKPSIRSVISRSVGQ